MKTEKLARIRSAIYSTPWAITPEWLESICGIVEAHASGEGPKSFTPRIKRGRRCPDCKTAVLKPIMVQGSFGPTASGDYTCPECGCKCNQDQLPPYEIVDGVALLELSGPLFPKANLMTMYSGATSYDEYSAMFSQAMEDENVSSILQISDSPGGSCLGMAETCSRIFAARESGSKPIFGMIDPQACSAAYAIMSQCDRLYISESGLAGSIGIIMRYNNWDRAERNEGNDPVMMTSSDVKSFGQPQSLAQYDSLREILISYFESFKEIVSRGRQGIDIEAVSDARIFMGRSAVKAGLVDGVSSLENILQELAGKEVENKR